MNKLVSVIMGVHEEDGSHLRVALDSICRQTYSNLEFIIIDDAANIDCRDILQEYAQKYDYIKLYRNDVNLGLTKSLNIGLAMAHGEYIARMDADDYSVPERLEKQYEYMEDHPEIDVCGTGVVSFGDRIAFMSWMKPVSNAELQCGLFFSGGLCHPSVMIKRSFLDRYGLKYDESIPKTQDFDLWERCSMHGQLAVMKEVLLFYRIHAKQISIANMEEQDYYADLVRRRRLARIGLAPTEREYKCHMLLAKGCDKSVSPAEVEQWAAKIVAANKKYSLVDKDALARELNGRLALFKLRNGHYSKLNGRDCVFLCKWSAMLVSMSFGKRRETRRFKKIAVCSV